MRKLASIREIKEIRPIANADSLELAIIDGWEVVVNKNEGFKVGDAVVYFEIDSVLPERPEFEFLRSKKFRIRTIKLRGAVSQGLVMPLTILPRGYRVKLGDDVTEVLGAKKYEPHDEHPAAGTTTARERRGFLGGLMRFAWYRRLCSKLNPEPDTSFPSWIKKTDEERLQNLSTAFEDWKSRDLKFSVTEKLDGCSATYFLDGRHFRVFSSAKLKKYIFGVCSRNKSLPVVDESAYWTVAMEYKLREAMEYVALYREAKSVVVQGEIIGKKIQGDKYGLEPGRRYTYGFYVYNIFVDGKKLHSIDMEAELGMYFRAQPVPLVARRVGLEATISDMVALARGKSTLADIKREGLVWRNYDENISFKVINPEFLLAYDE